MTTAPTPSEKVQRLAITLEIASAVPDMSYVTVPRHVARDASVELSRLQADNEHLQGSLEAQRLISDRAIALAKELEASKNASIHKLEMDALDLASENSILKRQEQAELEACKPLPLSYRSGVMASSVDGGAMVSLHFTDMAEAEAWFVEITDQYDAALVDKSPNLQEPLVDKTAKLQDRPAAMPSITGGSS
ncbi:hypothetical protein [Delftia lacustris]|uniref:hypothetical protein n=1 Tax=Delftia TaxID=80865 RepID=UPI002D7657AC|nr:hypothetical protein [Delftia lacustris]